MSKITISPSECSTEKQVLKLWASAHELKDYWILTDGLEVSIAKQRAGQSPTEQISMPVRTFNTLVKWWTKQQECRKEL